MGFICFLALGTTVEEHPLNKSAQLHVISLCCACDPGGQRRKAAAGEKILSMQGKPSSDLTPTSCHIFRQYGYAQNQSLSIKGNTS